MEIEKIKREIEETKGRVIRLRAEMNKLSYTLLDLKARAEYGTDFGRLAEKEKREIALMVAREQQEKENEI